MARKLINLDLDDLEKLAAMNCTQDEAAAWFGIGLRTFARKLEQRQYREVWEYGRGKGRVSIRRLQLEAARRGNVVMLIWLGKQLLGQRDRQEVTVVTVDAVDAEIARLEAQLAKQPTGPASTN